MSDERKHKCYFDLKGVMHLCDGAKLLLEYCSPKIEVPQIIDLTNGKTRDLGICIAKSKQYKGLSFNLCPFCGEKVLNNKEQLNTDKIPYYTGVMDNE